MTLRRKATAGVAVGTARLLARRSPARIRTVLGVLSRGAAPASYGQAERARRDVVAMSGMCAGQACVVRSLATALLCRATGVWPTWCTGVRTFPFRAHAWVEADGRPVAEPAEVGQYRALIRIGPRPSERCPLPTGAGTGDVPA
ncbi:lasso peptide biosynthesis B2 protein [Streptomyces sp. NPDC053560]|uniref:lasso peptide biosynthesis B2 protein n=1 Tax=Streptomyces sp. NPDC053560 TaxID=3365711 RepID=UPI0037CD7B58